MTTFNTGSNVPLKFRLTDKDGISIANAVVRLVAEKGSTIIVGSTPFVYDSATGQYKYEWNTPSGASAKGEWTLKYIMNYQSTESSPTRISIARAFRNRTVYTKDNRHKIVEANGKCKDARGSDS